MREEVLKKTRSRESNKRGDYAFRLVGIFHFVKILSVNECTLKKINLKWIKIKLCYSYPLKHIFLRNIPKNSLH